MKLILFDIDGTLLTSTGVGRDAVLVALEQVCGRSIISDGVSFAGRTDPAIIRDLLTANDVAPADINEILPVCMEAYASSLMHLLTPSSVYVFPGAADLVRSLHEADGVLLGLLTGNMRETAYLKLHAAGLGSFFEFGAFGSDRETRNDLPGIAAERAHAFCGELFPPEKTVIIGDTPHDIECGRLHGAHCIGVSTGPFSRAELASHKPDLLLNDFTDPSELFAFLEGI